MNFFNSKNDLTVDEFRKNLLKKPIIHKNYLKKTEQEYLKELNNLNSNKKFIETEILAKQFIKNYKQSPNAYNFLGLAEFGQKKFKDALKSFKKANAIKNDGGILNNIGLIYVNNNENSLALETFKKASKLNPNDINIKMNLASIYERVGDLNNSYKIRINVLEIDERNHETMYKILGMKNITDDDVKLFIEKMLRLHSQFSEDLKLTENIMKALKKLGMHHKALPFALKALELDPLNDNRYEDIAHILTKTNDIPLAKEYVISAIKLNPTNGNHYWSLGWIEQHYGKIFHAIALYKKALNYLEDKKKGMPLNNLGNAYLRIGEVELAFNHYVESQKYTKDYEIIQNYMCNLSYISEDLKTIFDEHKKHTKQLNDISKYSFLECQKNKTNNKIRIGYLSPDFRIHSVAFFFNQLLTFHNNDEFEIILYSNMTGSGDDITNQFKSKANGWRDIKRLDDDQVISLIQNDKINILVDLIGHFSGGRPKVFARKPAPIQVSYLGYVTTTGLKAMDYRFTTHEADPNNNEDIYYTEKLIRLPNTFLCYTGTNAYSVKNPPCIKQNIITFGSFNNLSKVTMKTIRIWCALLKKVDNSRMLLKSSAASDNLVFQNLINKFIKNGIDGSRIVFLPKAKTNVDHMKLYNQIDIAVDTFPFNGATTTVEALWMGVPVLTIKGKTHHGRVSTSILKVLQMNDFIADDIQDFVFKGEKASKDIDLLIKFRRNLRDFIKESYLYNGSLFAKNVEAEYKKMFLDLK